MKLSVTGRRVAVTDEHRDEIERKIERLTRVLNDAAVSAQVVLFQERAQIVCDLTVHARGAHVFHGVGRGPRAMLAVSGAVSKVEQQAKRLADRWKTRRKEGRQAARVPAVEPAARVGPRIVRTRLRALRPMSLEDAAIALTSGPQPVLVYRDVVSNAVAVLYRLPDGDLGLIEPEA